MMCSKRLREEGNALYRQAFSPSAYPILAPALRIDRARKAISLYEKARYVARASGDLSDMLSAMKNIAVSYLSLTTMDGFKERCDRTEDILFAFTESVKVFSEALSYSVGDGGKDSSWLIDISSKIVSVSASLTQHLIEEHECWEPRVGQILKIIRVINDSTEFPSAFTKCSLYLIAAEEAKKALIKADEQDDWRSCLQINFEASQYLSFARENLQRLAVLSATDLMLHHIQHDSLEAQVGDLQEDFAFYLGRAQSRQYRAIAEEITEELLFLDEELNMEKAYLVIDKLHEAIIHARDVCIESEAISFSQLGAFYEKVVKMETRASELYQQCHRLAQSITETTGANFYHSPWFIAAKDGLERIRAKRFLSDQAELAKTRGPFLEKLKPQLDAMIASHASCESKQYKLHLLLQYLYRTHPPKDPKNSTASALPDPFDRDDVSLLKKVTMAAIAAYHPDKPFNKTNGEEWFFLCEEIMKELNGLYEVAVKNSGNSST